MPNQYNFPDWETLEKIKRMYPKGCRVKLIHLSDYVKEILMRGEQGTVSFVDDNGTVFVDWDCGESFGIVYGADRIWKV